MQILNVVERRGAPPRLVPFGTGQVESGGLAYREQAPPAALAQVLHSVWSLTSATECAGRLRLLPDGRCEVILQLHGQLELPHAGRFGGDAHRYIAVGQLTRCVDVTHHGALRLVGIRLNTAAASTVFRRSIVEIVDRCAPLDTVAYRLRARIAEASRIGGADFAVLTHALASAVAQSVRRTPDALVASLVRSCALGTALCFESEAARSGITARTFQRRVLAATGIPPTLLRRIVRFRTTLESLLRDRSQSHSCVAHALGYYDHAHLIRDFRQFTSMTPGAFFARVPHANSLPLNHLHRYSA